MTAPRGDKYSVGDALSPLYVSLSICIRFSGHPVDTYMTTSGYPVDTYMIPKGYPEDTYMTASGHPAVPVTPHHFQSI